MCGRSASRSPRRRPRLPSPLHSDRRRVSPARSRPRLPSPPRRDGRLPSPPRQDYKDASISPRHPHPGHRLDSDLPRRPFVHGTSGSQGHHRGSPARGRPSSRLHAPLSPLQAPRARSSDYGVIGLSSHARDTGERLERRTGFSSIGGKADWRPRGRSPMRGRSPPRRPLGAGARHLPPPFAAKRRTPPGPPPRPRSPANGGRMLAFSHTFVEQCVCACLNLSLLATYLCLAVLQVHSLRGMPRLSFACS